MGGLPLVYAHAHLDQVGNPTASLQDAKASGVAGVVAVGKDVESNHKSLDIAREQPGYVHAALGYHPWEIHEEDVERPLSFIREHLKECVAIGESAGGLCGIATAFAGWYTSAAGIINAVTGRVILPVGPAKKAN